MYPGFRRVPSHQKPCLRYKGMTMTKRETQAREYAAEAAGERPSPTLTDEERAAIETAVRWLEPYPQVADTLRSLLERLK